MRKRGNDFWVFGDIAYVDVSTDKFSQESAQTLFGEFAVLNFPTQEC